MIRRLLILTCALAAVVPAAAQAAEPPNQKDPCARNGRDSCNTTGVGQYKTYRYGLRWFGDYRGAIRGVSDPAFCLDLRFWYPGRAYDFAQVPAAEGLRNREGEAVSAQRLRRMSYAIWNYGRTRSRASQGAVMLYVHRMMGDGARGEVDPNAAGPAVRAIYGRIARDAARYAGPYRVQLSLPAKLTAGRKAKLTARVLSASGRVVPNVVLRLDATGASGLAQRLDTGSGGVARASFAPAGGKAGVRVTATASGQLAAARPRIYVPRRADAARNGQRLALPASAGVSSTVRADVQRATLTVTTAAAPKTLLAGEQSRDEVTIAGAFPGWQSPVEVRLYGPFRSQAAISCAGAPVATTSYTAGIGPSTTPALTPPGPGWYGYQLTIAESDDVAGITTPCGEPAETFKVEVQPVVATQISSQTAAPGAVITDSVAVSGLHGEPVTVAAMLYGPYASAAAMTCEGAPLWSGSFVAPADGTYVTAPVTLTIPGYYTYRESIPAGEFVRPADTPCAAVSETTIVRGSPAITTQISAQEAAPGVAITDAVKVTGLGALSATVEVRLYGPFATPEEIRCDGTPFATSSLAAGGDGTYTSQPTTLERAGYYTYRESIAATAEHDGATTGCGEATETTIVRAKPSVRTVVSNALVRRGSSISDRIIVKGLGDTPAKIEVRLFGPYASRAAIDCAGAPLWRGTVSVSGDGTVNSPKVRLPRAGFYTYRERIAGTPLMAAEETACGEVAETSLASPLILTGRGDRVAQAQSARASAAASSSSAQPVRVQVPARGIDAPVSGVDIDTQAGALAIPKAIDRVGWWRDGAAPGSRSGTILLAGHVDSATRGAGAFYALKKARRGDIVSVRSANGTTRRYRISSIRRVRKAALPSSIFMRGGRRKLVLVTCGGPFDSRSGHYRDNLIVTAVPLV